MEVPCSNCCILGLYIVSPVGNIRNPFVYGQCTTVLLRDCVCPRLAVFLRFGGTWPGRPVLSLRLDRIWWTNNLAVHARMPLPLRTGTEQILCQIFTNALAQNAN